jgi:hypothetical protein
MINYKVTELKMKNKIDKKEIDKDKLKISKSHFRIYLAVFVLGIVISFLSLVYYDYSFFVDFLDGFAVNVGAGLIITSIFAALIDKANILNYEKNKLYEDKLNKIGLFGSLPYDVWNIIKNIANPLYHNEKTIEKFNLYGNDKYIRVENKSYTEVIKQSKIRVKEMRENEKEYRGFFISKDFLVFEFKKIKDRLRLIIESEESRYVTSKLLNCEDLEYFIKVIELIDSIIETFDNKNRNKSKELDLLLMIINAFDMLIKAYELFGFLLRGKYLLHIRKN